MDKDKILEKKEAIVTPANNQDAGMMSRRSVAECTKEILETLGKHGCKLVADATVRGDQFEVVGTRVRVVLKE